MLELERAFCNADARLRVDVDLSYSYARWRTYIGVDKVHDASVVLASNAPRGTMKRTTSGRSNTPSAARARHRFSRSCLAKDGVGAKRLLRHLDPSERGAIFLRATEMEMKRP